MNENINLTEILKNYPKGTKLYSTIFGEVSFITSNAGFPYPIVVKINGNQQENFTAKGTLYKDYNDSECVLFPSKDQRDWSKFTDTLYKNEKFDPKKLQPFDKVLVRYYKSKWKVDFFSHYEASLYCSYRCINDSYIYCIPYNDNTKHLVGTTDEAPDLYKYWEE